MDMCFPLSAPATTKPKEVFVKLNYTLAALSLSLCSCGLPSLALHPRMGAMDLDGHLAANTTGAPALATSTADLGLDEGEDEVMPRADLKWVGMHLSASQFTAAYAGTGQVDADIDLGGGNTIGADAGVATDLDLDVTSLHYTWDLIPGETVEAGIGLGLALVDFKTSIVETSSPNSVSTEEFIPVPLLAARLGFNLGPVELSGVAGFLQISDGDNEASVRDLDLMAVYEVFSGTGASLGLNVGYRQFDLEANYGDGDSTVDMDLGLSGIYYGITLAF